MKIIDKSLLSEVKKMKDGEIGLFEYVDCGQCYQDKFMVLAARCSLKLIFTIMMQKLEKLSIASVATMRTITIWLLL